MSRAGKWWQQAIGLVERDLSGSKRRQTGRILGWVEGFEPSATGTTIRRSTKLSYTHRMKGLFYRNKALREVQTYAKRPARRFHAGRAFCLRTHRTCLL